MRIAVAQTPGTRLDQWPQTLGLIDEMITRAASLRADLVVLPECVWPAYWLGSREEYFAARRSGLPGPADFLTTVQAAARQRSIAVCIGYVAENGQRLLNAAALIDREGRICGTHYKSFLWAFDRDCFEPGQRLEPIQAGVGRVGLMICADARLPEIPATLASRGAELLLHPTAWVNAGTSQQLWNPQPDFLIAARAAELGLPIASASKWGPEGDETFVGSSLICDAAGRVLVQCGSSESAVVVAQVELTGARRPQVTDAERAKLLTFAPPSPAKNDVPSLGIVPLPPMADGAGVDWWKGAGMSEAGAMLGFTFAPRERGVAATPVGPADRALFLAAPSAATLELAGICIAALDGSDAARFAKIRSLALQGLHLAVVFGSGASTTMLRARACENRVFVLVAEHAGWRLIDPRGHLISQAGWPTDPPDRPAMVIQPGLAADKLVAPRTDVIAGRRPEQYEF